MDTIQSESGPQGHCEHQTTYLTVRNQSNGHCEQTYCGIADTSFDEVQLIFISPKSRIALDHKDTRMLPLMSNGEQHSLPVTEASETTDATVNYKIEKKRKVQLDKTNLLYQMSAKGRSSTKSEKTPRRLKKKSKKRGEIVQRIENVERNPNEIKTLDGYDLPTVLPDYSSRFGDMEDKVGLERGQSRKIRKVHRPWHSPRRNTSHSESSGSESTRGCTSPPATGCCSIHPVPETSSAITLLPGVPTPSGLYAHTPLGFNGYLRYTFKCVYCSKLFETSTSLYDHCNYHHYGDKSYECPFCKERFSLSMHYAEHLNKHIFTKSFPTYKCEVCSIGFSSVWELELHSVAHTHSFKHTDVLCKESY